MEGHHPNHLKFYKFLVEKKPCACLATDTYLVKCESWRVHFIKPHRVVTSSTVSRWLKEGLRMADINTGPFKCRSTRASSTTKENVTGVPVLISCNKDSGLINQHFKGL